MFETLVILAIVVSLLVDIAPSPKVVEPEKSDDPTLN